MTSKKALVKRLIGVVADLNSKIERILQKKDEPDTAFGEDEDMVNEEEEETYYYRTQLEYDDTSTYGLEGEVGHTYAIHTKIEENHKTKEKIGVESLEKANEDIVNEQIYCDMEWLAHGKTADERKVDDTPSRTQFVT
ncbi:unnamed protein product [Lactuca saligna]|uniref:Uncharacterized protein n=1 Tax=Lactuca saligna TaxID=75948 RepID=A0AA36E252_LACSI|nr:unnamed protein product [Lactuca saligna]